MKIERAILDAATRLRDIFQAQDQPYLYFTVEVTGPVDRDELRITYRVGSSQYGESCVEADTVEAATDEFFRRKVFKSQHDNLRLPYHDRHTEE